jgi:glycosyltransferase involved in cell wall biosynthesis
MSTDDPMTECRPLAADLPPTVVCVTPVKNEAWILDRFLACASLWAEHIIIADQGSDDGSREIIRGYPRARLIENRSPSYNERDRQQLLIAAAREIPAPRLIVALDADEMLTANWAESPEWKTVLRAPPGTVIRFQWVNICPDLSSCWVPDADMPFGFVDDGSAHRGELIHSPRVPVPSGSPSLLLRDIKVLHYQYTDWQRMKSKQRWYQCWERIHNPKSRPTSIFRLYHRADAVVPRERQPLRWEWTAGYERLGIDMTSVRRPGEFRWDRDVMDLFTRHGVRAFRHLDVWDADWTERARADGSADASRSFRDPRGPAERLIHQWLRWTQRHSASRWVRLGDRVLRAFGW